MNLTQARDIPACSPSLANGTSVRFVNPDEKHGRKFWPRFKLFVLVAMFGYGLFLAVLNLNVVFGVGWEQIKVYPVPNQVDTIEICSDGLFETRSSLSLDNGTRLSRNEVLGTIRPTLTDSELREKQQIRKSLQDHFLRRTSKDYDISDELLSLELVRIDAWLAEAYKPVDVVCPIDGILLDDVENSQVVRRNTALLHIWRPERGLHFRMSGPQAAIERALERESVIVAFRSSVGRFELELKPQKNSLKNFVKSHGDRDEIWTDVLCVASNPPPNPEHFLDTIGTPKMTWQSSIW